MSAQSLFFGNIELFFSKTPNRLNCPRLLARQISFNALPALQALQLRFCFSSYVSNYYGYCRYCCNCYYSDGCEFCECLHLCFLTFLTSLPGRIRIHSRFPSDPIPHSGLRIRITDPSCKTQSRRARLFVILSAALTAAFDLAAPLSARPLLSCI